jgi:predicted flap endonuclease-1-like 5' DNA nuclease
MLVLKNGERYKEDGEVIRFKTGADATQADIDKINEILGYKIKRIKDTGGGGGVGSKYNIE